MSNAEQVGREFLGVSFVGDKVSLCNVFPKRSHAVLRHPLLAHLLASGWK